MTFYTIGRVVSISLEAQSNRRDAVKHVLPRARAMRIKDPADTDRQSGSGLGSAHEPMFPLPQQLNRRIVRSMVWPDRRGALPFPRMLRRVGSGESIR